MPRGRGAAGHLVPAAPDQPAGAEAGAGPAHGAGPAAGAGPGRAARRSWTRCTARRFADLAPDEVWATLLDEGTYLGSVSTYYRVLREAGESRERRAQATHPAAVKPELVATGPNQVYSWDITKLHGPAKWTYYHLYVILDIYSRYAVGWMVATRESAVLAEKLIAATCAKQGITRGQLSLHADRGSSMTSKPVALLLADLGVTQSHSRPHVSNDNPYSEAQFKTLKYRPAFPARFPSIEAARAHCQEFFPWYNNEHHHGGLGLHTAADVHHGHAPAVRAGAPRSWTPPTTPTPSASSASRPPRRNCQAHPGSTRPHVSNDNPYSEAQFKTLKYRPAFPARFPSIEAARAHCQEFFPWYNNDHHHGGLGLHTAADIHHGHAPAIRAARAQVLDAAYRAHPERFVSRPPVPPKLPGTSWINPPQEKETSTQ